MTFTDALGLGRVSNLPTVWTNMLTGIVLAGGAVADSRVWLLLAALTLFYVAGMYLNDAFDADIDAVERPERPIPAGRVSRSTVFTAGFAMLAIAIALLFAAGRVAGTGVWPGMAGLALAGVIVFYNWHHKSNPLSPSSPPSPSSAISSALPMWQSRRTSAGYETSGPSPFSPPPPPTA
jgi:4-hydroxybenzoate polyprenyltransferase